MQLLLLENVRFYKEEEKNDPEFAKKVRKLQSPRKEESRVPVDGAGALAPAAQGFCPSQ